MYHILLDRNPQNDLPKAGGLLWEDNPILSLAYNEAFPITLNSKDHREREVEEYAGVSLADQFPKHSYGGPGNHLRNRASRSHFRSGISQNTTRLNSSKLLMESILESSISSEPMPEILASNSL